MISRSFLLWLTELLWIQERVLNSALLRAVYPAVTSECEEHQARVPYGGWGSATCWSPDSVGFRLRCEGKNKGGKLRGRPRTVPMIRIEWEVIVKFVIIHAISCLQEQMRREILTDNWSHGPNTKVQCLKFFTLKRLTIWYKGFKNYIKIEAPFSDSPNLNIFLTYHLLFVCIILVLQHLVYWMVQSMNE